MTTQAPASASAVASEPVRYLAFDGDAVRQLLAKGGDISRAVDNAFRQGLREKLLRANEALVGVGRSPGVRSP